MEKMEIMKLPYTLHAPSFHGRQAIFRLLLEKEAGVDALELQAASSGRQGLIVRRLLEGGQ